MTPQKMTDKLQLYANELDGVESSIEESITTLRRLNITAQSDPNFIVKQISTQSDAIEELLEKAKKLYNKINNLAKNDPSLEDRVNDTKKKHKDILSKLRTQFKQAKSFIETKSKGLTEGVVAQPTPTQTSSSSQKEPSTTSSTKGIFGFGNKQTPAAYNEEDDVVEVKRTSDVDMYKGNQNLSKEQRQRHDEIEKELFAEVFSTQKDCLDIIERLNKKADETMSMASDSAALLKEQREQLMRIDEEMDALGTNVQRAQKEVRSFLRRIQTDKCCAVLCLLVALAILGGCILAIVFKFVPIPNINPNNNQGGNSTRAIERF